MATTYEDSVAKLTGKASAALFKGITKDWEQAKIAVKDAADLELIAINKLRACGIKLQEVSNHEQVTFGFYDSHRTRLPRDMTFKAAKLCIHLARSFETPVKSLDDARKARQMMFEAFGQSAAPHRIGEQTAHEVNPWSDFVARFASIETLFEKLDEEPMEDWGESKLRKFISTTLPIAQRHDKAAKLLEVCLSPVRN